MAITRSARRAAVMLACLVVVDARARAENPADAPVTSVALGRSLAGLRERTAVLADSDDLIDSLYFGWCDRPYHRATLACALKTLAVLDREHRLREAGNGAMDDVQVRQLLDWMDAAIARSCAATVRDGYLPHRIPVGSRRGEAPDARQLVAVASSENVSMPLIGFVDRASLTPNEDGLGDLDLLACCGFRIYGLSDTRSAIRDGLQAHAHALDIDVAVIGHSSSPAGDPTTRASVGEARWVFPATLGAILDAGAADSDAPSRERTLTTILMGPPAGESWGESAARRGLYRGCLGANAMLAGGCGMPSESANVRDSVGRLRAELWVAACDGQTTLLEGWRDLRDGSTSPYASLATTPWLVEAAAHAWLDLLYVHEHISRRKSLQPIALVVDRSAVDPNDDNRWHPKFTSLFDAFSARQISFDLVSPDYKSAASTLARYDLVLDLTGWPVGEEAPPDRVPVSVRGAPADWRPLAGGQALTASTLADRTVEWLDGTWPAMRAWATTPNGALAGNVFVRRSSAENSGATVLAINLSETPQRVQLRAGRLRLDGVATDQFEPDRTIDLSRGVDLGAWQVRVLALR